MADLTKQSTLAVKVESPAGTWANPGSSDTLVVNGLDPQFEEISAEVDEYTGAIDQPGRQSAGKIFGVSFRMYLRGPGGTEPPAADAFPLGRVLRAVGFGETVVSAAVPAAAEALGAGSTTTMAKLGTTAVATADLYTGYLLELASLGTIGTKAALTMIRDYLVSKDALLPITMGSAPTGNYQIPKQLLYRWSSAARPNLSVAFWLGTRRFNGVGCSVSSARFNAPTFGRESQELPSIDVTLTGDFHSTPDADEASPVSAPTLAIPSFRGGNLWVAGKQLGGSGIEIDLGVEVGFPPNPNKDSGNDTSQVVSARKSVTLNLNQVPKATFDHLALFDAQAYHPMFASWGSGRGNSFGIIVPDARLGLQNPQTGGNFVTTTGEMLIDAVDKAICIGIAY